MDQVKPMRLSKGHSFSELLAEHVYIYICAGELEGLYPQISLTMLIEFMFTYLNCIRLLNGLWQLADGTFHTHYQMKQRMVERISLASAEGCRGRWNSELLYD